MINRKEEIKKKGFKMSFVDSTSNSETQNSFVPVDFSRIKVGAKTLEDAILDLGNYQKVDKRLARREAILKSLYDNDYAENTIKHQYDLFVKKHPDASAKEITKEISKKLVTGKTDRRSTAKVKTSESIKTDALTSFVKSFEGDPNDPFAE